MITKNEALAELLRIVEKEKLSAKGFRLFGLNTDYTTWDDDYPYKRSLTSLFKKYGFTLENIRNECRTFKTTYIYPWTRKEEKIFYTLSYLMMGFYSL
ncbi:MAG: hypothetical protein QXS66_08540 [Thermoproteota archaeon]